VTTDFIVLAVVASTLFLVEIVIRHQREMPIDARETSVSATVGVLGYSMKAVVEQLALLAVNFWVADHLAPWRLPFSNPLTWVAYFVVGDFVYYWIHQAKHRVRILWASHLVHHSAEDFGFTTAVRLSPAEVFYKPFTGLWAPLLGFPPAIYAPMAVLSLQLQHTEVVGRLGMLDRWFATPSNHRVHHGRNKRYTDKNFGGQTMLWDHLFGTYEPETEPVVYGSTEALTSR
jgi:alkylglycerol monooxygenase